MSSTSVFERFWTGLPIELRDRLVGATFGLPSGIVLGIARWLEPDPAGVGTHQQLGLGGCSILTFTGWPCPMCGMTTTFAHLAHGNLVQGIATQPFGVALFLVTLAFCALGLADLAVPSGRLRRIASWLSPWEVPIAISVLVGMTLGWIYKVLVIRPDFLG